MQAADRVVAVSEYTKLLAMRNYGISSRKITVIHNAVDVDISVEQEPMPIYSTDKVVTFMGRVTTQKGPQYFVDAAVLVSKKIKNVRFVMAGKGDLLEEMKHRVEILGVSGYFSFPGFVPDEKIGELFQETDVFVMPSVSEPFGIVALEAMQAGLPVVITRQSGVSEVVKNALKVDYWDTEAMAEAICSVLTNEKLKEKLSVKGEKETQKLVWAASALKLHKLYKSLLK
jgi:glycosyltransferase involved in cell wall biosynthesis